jgi:uncharacterized protein (TIRG00374 family)
MTRRWQATLGVVVSLLLLYWALHDVKPAEIVEHIRSANIWLLLLAVAAATFAFVIRAARWQIFLKPALAKTSFRNRFAATCIGFMANNLLPARVGEFARAYALSRVEPISISASFGSLVVERLFDALTLALFLAVPLLLPGFIAAPGLGDEIFGKLVLVLLIFGGATLALLALILRPKLATRTFRATVGRLIPAKAADKIVDVMESFIEGLGAMRSPELVIKGFAWSLALWLWGALGLYLGLLAFDIITPGYVGAIFLQAVNAFAVSIPSSPGFFGLFEASVRFGLTPFGVQPGQAFSFAIAYHILAFFPVTIMGLFYVGRVGLSWSEVGHSEEIVEESA